MDKLNNSIAHSIDTESATSLIFKALMFVVFTYILLILSAFLVILIGSAIIFLVYYIPAHFFNRIYGGLILMVGIGIGVGVVTMICGILKSLLPSKSFHPAIIINQEEHPEFLSFLNNLCDSMKTDLPDAIILHCEPTFFVQQGRINTFNGYKKGRILAIGMPLLEYLSINQLRGILAHEFAHFTGNDTLYSAHIYPVYKSTINVIKNLTLYISQPDDDSYRNNKAAIALPLILPLFILNLYYNKFHTSNMKRSREREKRADIIASSLCGSESFKTGIMNVVTISRVFEENTAKKIIELHNMGQMFTNYYRYFGENISSEVIDTANQYLQKELEVVTYTSDSHPALKDRLASIIDVGENYNDTECSISLFNSIEKIEEALTEGYTSYIEALYRLNKTE